MLRRFAFLTVLMLVCVGHTDAATWNVDPVHSSVQFKVRHMVISKTKGDFTKFEGSISFDGDLNSSSVELTIQASSIDTDNEDRDKHISGPDFLDAEKFPTMTFVSKKIVAGDDGEFELIGDLTIKDVTKEVSFACEFLGETDDPWGNRRMGFSASSKIDRKDFHVNYEGLLESGGLTVGNDIQIMIEIEAIKEKTEEKSK